MCQHWAEPGGLTGSLDTNLPAFPGFPGMGGTCDHELCSTGDALDASCDPCVSLVCADDPACCDASGGSWDILCVDAVYESCLMTTRPMSLCDFGLFSSSTNQVTLDSLGATSDITVGGLGNITVSGSSGKSVRRIVTAGPAYLAAGEFPALGVLAGGDITLNSGTTLLPVGPLESGGNVSMYGTPVVSGNVLAQGNIVWETNIYGDALAGGNVTLSGGCAGSVFGGTCQNASTHGGPTLALPTLPAQTFACGGADTNVGGGDLVLVPGSYGDIYVGGELAFSGSGTYNFNRLYAHDIRLDAGGGRVDVEVCNEFNVLSGGQILDAAGSLLADPAQLVVSVQGNLHFDSNVDWVGVVLAGSSGTKSGGSINGAIWASPVNDINSQSSIWGIPREDCIALSIDGTTPPACPITSSSPPVPAALVEPCSSGLDCQINHRCEAPFTDASCAHSKCGAGGALDSSCDTCVSAICDQIPSCCSTAWDSICVAAVASVCDAVCHTASPPDESGSCVHNDDGYGDVTCSGFDLSLDIPCGESIPVCNHGTADFSGILSLGIYDSSSPTMSDPAPPAPTMMCTDTVSIPAGTCQTMTCAGLGSGTHTLVVDPDDLLDECGTEDRRWDNWTVHDGRTCDTTASYEFDYVATCDEPGTVPRWGLLTYNATIPGSTSIIFSARTGAGDTNTAAASNAAAQPFVELLTANSSLASCQPGDMLPCPLDLTSLLSLGENQGHHLDLRIEINSTENENPTLSDWDITYSCVFDE